MDTDTLVAYDNNEDTVAADWLYMPLMSYYDQRPANPGTPRDDIWRRGVGVAGGPR